jgi:hypothetical protein
VTSPPSVQLSAAVLFSEPLPVMVLARVAQSPANVQTGGGAVPSNGVLERTYFEAIPLASERTLIPDRRERTGSVVPLISLDETRRNSAVSLISA